MRQELRWVTGAARVVAGAVMRQRRDQVSGAVGVVANLLACLVNGVAH